MCFCYLQGWRMPATTANGRRGRIYYGTQARTRAFLALRCTAVRCLFLQLLLSSPSSPPTHSPTHPSFVGPLQAGVKPPTFVLFCNDTKLFPEDYKKFIERQFRWVEKRLFLF
jgi:predicted GTPase